MGMMRLLHSLLQRLGLGSSSRGYYYYYGYQGRTAATATTSRQHTSWGHHFSIDKLNQFFPRPGRPRYGGGSSKCYSSTRARDYYHPINATTPPSYRRTSGYNRGWSSNQHFSSPPPSYSTGYNSHKLSSYTPYRSTYRYSSTPKYGGYCY